MDWQWQYLILLVPRPPGARPPASPHPCLLRPTRTDQICRATEREVARARDEGEERETEREGGREREGERKGETVRGGEEG